jgi:hypothetical protein
VKKSENKRKKRKKRLESRFALFHFEAKITKSKQSEKFEAKKVKKCEKMRKKFKKSEKKRKKAKKREKSAKINLNFASLCFTSKQKLPKWSEAKNSKEYFRKTLFSEKRVSKYGRLTVDDRGLQERSCYFLNYV